MKEISYRKLPFICSSADLNTISGQIKMYFSVTPKFIKGKIQISKVFYSLKG